MVEGASRFLCWARLVLAGLVLSVGAGGEGSWAWAAGRDREVLLGALGDAEPGVRERALGELLTDESVAPEELILFYKEAQNPEQRNRLRGAYQHHVIRRMRVRSFGDASGGGSIGIAHAAVAAGGLPQFKRSAVRVVRCFPGFPGYAYLRAGDLIVAVGGQAVPAMSQAREIETWFVERIKEHQAGAVVELTVERDGRAVGVTFQLASVAALQGMYRDRDMALQEPFLSQWKAARDLLVGPVAVDAWRVDLPGLKGLEEGGAVEAAEIDPGFEEPVWIEPGVEDFEVEP